MKSLLKLVAIGICLMMIVVTVRASLAMALWNSLDSFRGNPWAVATLYDAYSGFTLFWLWVAYKERSWGMRLLWLVLIYGLGNIATSFYLLLAFWRLKPGEPVHAVLRAEA
jgi:hypothetical protein